jgi:hypothetical protein
MSFPTIFSKQLSHKGNQIFPQVTLFRLDINYCWNFPCTRPAAFLETTSKIHLFFVNKCFLVVSAMGSAESFIDKSNQRVNNVIVFLEESINNLLHHGVLFVSCLTHSISNIFKILVVAKFKASAE